MRYRPPKTGKNIECLYCKELFYAKRCLIESGRKKFCNRTCADLFKKGQKTRPCSGETKKKISEARSRKEFCTCKWCGKPFGKAPSDFRQRNYAHCSLECRRNSAIGNMVMCGGYRKIYLPTNPNAISGYVLEHRYIAEGIIGRRLKRRETIHHINEAITDNRPENLYLFQTNNDHLIYHNKLRYGKVEEITESNLWIIAND